MTAALEVDHREVRLDLLYSIPTSPSLLWCNAAINPDTFVLSLVMPKPSLQHVDSLFCNFSCFDPRATKAESPCKLWASDIGGEHSDHLVSSYRAY